MDAKNLFLDPDKQEKSAEKLSRDRKSAIGFRDATSGRKRRTYWIEAQKHAWTNSVVSPKKSPPRKSTKLNWFLCSHAIRRGGKRISGEKPLGKEHPKIYLQASGEEMLPCMLVCDATLPCHETCPSRTKRLQPYWSKRRHNCALEVELSNSTVANSTVVLTEGRGKRPQELHKASWRRSRRCKMGPQNSTQ